MKYIKKFHPIFSSNPSCCLKGNSATAKQKIKHQPHYHKNQVGFILRNVIQQPKHIGGFSFSTRSHNEKYFFWLNRQLYSRRNQRLSFFLDVRSTQRSEKKENKLQTLQLKLHVSLTRITCGNWTRESIKMFTWWLEDSCRPRIIANSLTSWDLVRWFRLLIEL